MGWSEWIQAPDYTTSPNSLNFPYYGVVQSSAVDSGFSGSPVNTATVVAGLQSTATAGSSLRDPGGNTNIEANVSGTTQQNPDTGGYHHNCEASFTQTVANISIPTADILDYRDTYPALLGSLVEGVDFSVIPSTTDYVEYEALPTTLIGWQDWIVPLRYVETFNTDIAPQAATSRVAYCDPPITDWATIPPWQAYGVGTSLTTLTTAVGAPGDYVNTGGVLTRDTTTDVTIPLSVMGNAAAVSLFMQPTHLGGGSVPGVVDVGGGPAGGPWDVTSILDHTAPIRYAFRLPRFRYWKLASPPLRQVQRDDGLGRSVVRARGTHSVQKSIRQRGYR